MRPEKKVIVEELREKIRSSQSMIFTKYDGLNAQSLGRLRELSRSKKSQYMVVKNTLFRRAAQEEQIADLGLDLTGSTGVLFGKGDAAALAKIFVDFEKGNGKLKVQGGFLDKSPLSKEQVKYLASLPSKQELQAQLLAQLAAPLSNLVRVLSALPRNFVTVLTRIKEKKEQTS